MKLYSDGLNSDSDSNDSNAKIESCKDKDFDEKTLDEIDHVTLPVFRTLPEGAIVSIKGINDPVMKYQSEVLVKSYVQKVLEDREQAISTARAYRDQVEVLEIENRELLSKMNKSIHAIKMFWRNKIAEGSTRSGKCVQKALRRNTAIDSEPR